MLGKRIRSIYDHPLAVTSIRSAQQRIKTGSPQDIAEQKNFIRTAR